MSTGAISLYFTLWYKRPVSHVVMQAGEFGTVDDAKHVESELQQLVESYVEFEKTDPDPWGTKRVPPPLEAFGKRHGIEWPLVESALFLLKGLFEEEANVTRVDRMVFFWGGGFELGGKTLRIALRRMGAVACIDFCHLVVRSASPKARLAKLTRFLVDEDFEDQFSVLSDPAGLEGALFSITLEDDDDRKYLIFDDSGVQDWAFVSLLPQLEGEDPRLRR